MSQIMFTVLNAAQHSRHYQLMNFCISSMKHNRHHTQCHQLISIRHQKALRTLHAITSAHTPSAKVTLSLTMSTILCNCIRIRMLRHASISVKCHIISDKCLIISEKFQIILGCISNYFSDKFQIISDTFQTIFGHISNYLRTCVGLFSDYFQTVFRIILFSNLSMVCLPTQ